MTTAQGPLITTGSESPFTERVPPGREEPSAELAPDPPGSRHFDGQLVTYQQNAETAADKPAGKAKKIEPAGRAATKSQPPSPPPSSPAPAAGSEPRPLPAGTPPTAAPLTLATPRDPAAPLGLAPLGLGSQDKNIAAGKGSPLSAMITVGGSLAIVLGLFLVVAWVLRKTAPHGSLVLPKEVFDILGRAPLGARQQVQLLRCGNKLLLVSITPGGAETLTEVTEPIEVDRIAGICHQAHPKSATTAFRQVFQQLAPSSAAPADIESLEPPSPRRKRYHWEEKHA